MMKRTHVLTPLLLLSCVGISPPLLATGARLEDRMAEPRFSFCEVETVAQLDLPPGNVAVSPEGRVFFTYLPQARPPVKVAELVAGQVVPFPDEAFQKRRVGGLGFDTVLSIRI